MVDYMNRVWSPDLRGHVDRTEQGNALRRTPRERRDDGESHGAGIHGCRQQTMAMHLQNRKVARNAP